MAASAESQYWTILEAVEAAAEALLSADRWNVVIGERPAWEPAWADLPACVIAPHPALAESVKKLNFRNDSTQIAYDVFVGLFVDGQSNSRAQLRRRLAARQAVREAFWRPDLLAAAVGDFDVDYQPFALMGESPPTTARGSWQLFTISIKARRQSP